ncbi:MAG: GntR family transcriptional regulator [Actinomycetota bacterium]|jgi:GntR family transcriptional regulator|nr:GntR family transcriptional regulator [Actinomycetota bacterium]
MTGARFRQLAHELRERISLGDFGESGALESEAALGRRYDVSRVTVRKALEELREQGLVESRPGAGWFVSATSFHQTLALGTFRHASSAVAAAGKTVVRRVVDFGYRPAPEPVADALGLDSADALYSRSVRTVDGEPLDLVQEWVPALVADRVSRADAERLGIWATLQRQGYRVSSVRQTISAGLASPGDAELLDVATGSPLLLVRRLALGQDGGQLALSDHRYLAHRFSLEVEFRGWPVASTTETPGLRALPAAARTA